MKRGNVKNRLLDRYLGIPILLGTSLFQARRQQPNRIQRIGLIASPTLGDTLLTSACTQDLRRCFPDAHIIYFSVPSNTAAANLLPEVDEIAPISFTNPLQTVRTMRRLKLDVLFDFSSWQRMIAFCVALSGAAYRVGFRSAKQYRHWNYDLAVHHSRRVHELDNFRRLLRAFGVPSKAQPALKLRHVSPPEFDGYTRIVVFHPWASGAKSWLREWPSERWVALAYRLATAGTLFVITGSPADRANSTLLCDKLQHSGLSAQPYLSQDGLASVSALLKAAQLVVSVNTGIMHLASILGTPTVALNGPTATHRWGPSGPRSVAVEPDGRGGFLHFGFEFAGNPTDCMERISVNRVFAAASAIESQGLGSEQRSQAVERC
jgi:heptosyltransferase-3